MRTIMSSHPNRGAPALRSVIDTSDGVIMISPEYNHGMSGVLKNALDWASRPYGRSGLRDRPVLTMTASPALTGAVRARSSK
jgi:chromate reductase, NAD(P)H dehydrogenase (quinone)